MAKDAWTTSTGLERAVLVATCAISAGIHGALVREHLAEGVGPGLGFPVATFLLLGVAVALSIRASERLLLASAAVLAGLIVAYLFAVATGLPFLHPDVEPVDGLALVTKAGEALGLLVALDLLGRTGLDLNLHERTANEQTTLSSSALTRADDADRSRQRHRGARRLRRARRRRTRQ